MLKDFISYMGFAIRDGYRQCKKTGSFSHIFHKSAMVIALVLWLVAAGRVLINEYRKSGKEEIITAFNSEAYTHMEAVISTYGKYGNINITDTAKKLVLEDMARQIGVEDYSISDMVEGDTSTKVLCKDSVNGSVICKFITVGEIPEAECNQYISVEVRLNNAVSSAFAYEEKLKKLVDRLDMDSPVTVNLVGEIPGKLSDGMINILADTMVGQIDAKVVTDNRDEQLFTVYAYDEDIDNYIKMGKDKVNVNLSIAYDEQDNVTCVYLSTPISNLEY